MARKNTTAEPEGGEVKTVVPETGAAETGARTDANGEAERILAAARAQAEEIVAAARREAEEAARAARDTEGAPEPPAVPPGEELVPIRLFKDNDKYKDDVFVAVNGERVQIRRGETVMVKKKFADVLEQSMQQDMATASLIERESSRYDAEAKARGL